ncbi:uncharacterized protein LOC111907652 isoform X2 [Lactuca sativa]|uniref:uncharacterized protein LOC111907652 isoform X2 n=1 Tax=Lactuca sativa TaxID=4236 RepID=UPI000CD9EB3F|nr:uncharacterized protein LOC111907652 isoform X2 [Lactuca sativa]
MWAGGVPVHHQTMNTQGQTVMYARGGRRRKVLDVDLNDTPPNEDHEQVEGPLLSLTHGGQLQAVDHNHNQLPVISLTPGSSPPVPIDVEELDDDVIISSPRAFEQARNSSRRIARRTSVIDVESEEVGNHRNQRRRVEPQPQVMSGGLYVILEGSSSSMEERAVVPPPPPEPTFNCPVCMGPLVEEVTTKCGHIFCKGCIKAAIAAQAKCPTCRRKVTNRELIRIYLPSTS